MPSRLPWLALSLAFLPVLAAPMPPLVCPAGAPIGNVDLRVISAGNAEPLPLRTINRLQEGDRLQYRPILRSGEERKGKVSLVLVPANRDATGGKLLILEPKDAKKVQEWNVPWRVGVVGFVYGPSGLNEGKIKNFLSRDDELVAQLADYAEKTAQTEALISALSSPNSSSALVQSALQGFSSQFGINVQLDKNAPANQQAMALFRNLNPAIASYDPIAPRASQQVGQTASLATSVAALFFGSPVGLAAGGTAMVMELRSIAFPKAEFRSLLSQTMPGDAMGLCGRVDPAAPHTKVAYLWAARLPNLGLPDIYIKEANVLPPGVKSPLPVTAADDEWKFIDRARTWALEPETGLPIPVAVNKLNDPKQLEIQMPSGLKPGKYQLSGRWDWDPFKLRGDIIVRDLANFQHAKLTASSQDLLVARTGKVPLTLVGADFEFVKKIEVEKVNDKFASPSTVPFVLPRGVRQGDQDHMDIQLNTIDMDPGPYRLKLTQVDDREHAVPLHVLPAPPQVENLPVTLSQGVGYTEFTLRGQRLDLITGLEVSRGKAELTPSNDPTSRRVILRMATDIDAGTSLALKAFTNGRTEPLTFSDAVRVVGPRPRITELRVSQLPTTDVQLDRGELPASVNLGTMIKADHLQSNSVVKLTCTQPNSAVVTLRLGERSGQMSLQQLAPGQLFLSFDTGVWLNGCLLNATILNGNESESDPYGIGRIVRLPHVESLTVAAVGVPGATLAGQNLETIEKAGWSDQEGVEVPGLPLPVNGEWHKQTLEIPLPPPSPEQTQLYVWLRGESKARPTRIHAQVAPRGAPAATPQAAQGPPAAADQAQTPPKADAPIGQ
ncbi:hypothetical protein [uncultured Paludibaculum sp.]|uniref:hypothetical protein n=1 Tax=uncultured Paludibaculum sp. TaxID=1765020 RepID=UPI002AAC3AB6|nr:hypothetical protein [uncultured Paludibaculum sp.]